MKSNTSMLEWLDGVHMTESNRNIAKNQVRMAEAVIDALWRAGSFVRAAIAGQRRDRIATDLR